MPIIGFKRTKTSGKSIQGGGFFGSFTSQSIEGGGYYGQFIGQSGQGGGYYGVFSGQSAQGGGSVSGIPTRFTTGGSGQQGGTRGGFFFKVASLPASDMTLFDYNGGSTAYLRGKLTSAGHVKLESSLNGTTQTVDLTPTTVTATGVWYWCGFAISSASGTNSHLVLKGQVYGPGGAGDGQQASNINYGSQSGVYAPSCVLGWGTSQTTAYLAFPNTTGNEMSKFESGTQTTDDIVIFGPPTSDVSTSGLDVLYLCRDATGSQSTLLDSTSNARDLTAGSQGITVVTDGPY